MMSHAKSCTSQGINIDAVSVGIVTNYLNNNYGSVLQSYALQEVLRKMSIQGENIQWHSHPSPYWTYRFARRCFHRAAVVCSSRRRRLSNFNAFRKRYIKESSAMYCTLDHLEAANGRYDAFICGSDQIWAPNQFHERYYLGFAHDTKTKIAYAPSIGLPIIPPSLKPRMAMLLQRLDYISIRERAGAELIKQLTGRDVEVVLDPTLLLDRRDWLTMAAGDSPCRNYILCYFLGDNPKQRQKAVDFKRKTGWSLVVLPSRNIDYEFGDFKIGGAGPDRFIQLVDNARWVLTDSYHGMIFSILMNKPFSVFMRFANDHPLCQNSRVEHLLGQFGIKSRIVDTQNMSGADSIDYEFINRMLVTERHKSIQYLKRALSGLF